MKRLLAWAVVSAPFVLIAGWIIFINVAWVASGNDNDWPGFPAFTTDIVLAVFGIVAFALIVPDLWHWARAEIAKPRKPRKSEKEIWP